MIASIQKVKIHENSNQPIFTILFIEKDSINTTVENAVKLSNIQRRQPLL